MLLSVHMPVIQAGVQSPKRTTLTHRVSGPKTQQRLHINRLELMAAQNALLTLCANLNEVHVLIKSDNRSTVSYISKMGGTVGPLNDLTYLRNPHLVYWKKYYTFGNPCRRGSHPWLDHEPSPILFGQKTV